MTSFDDFIAKYNGKQVEVAGSAGAEYQCVDLANAYIRECLNFPIIEWTDAKDFPLHCGDYFDYIKNTPEGVPVKGDLVVWTASVGSGHGHIACFIEGDANSFTSFDQNWSTPLRCKIEGHSYQYVGGWMHPKGVTMDCLLFNTDADRKTFSDLVGKASKLDDFVKAGYNTVADVNTIVGDLRKSIDDKAAEVILANSKANDYRIELNDFVALLAGDEYLKCRQDKTEIANICGEYGKKMGELEDLRTAFAALKNDSETTESNLRAEVARLTALLSNENVLTNVKFEDLLKEIIRRLTSLLSKK